MAARLLTFSAVPVDRSPPLARRLPIELLKDAGEVSRTHKTVLLRDLLNREFIKSFVPKLSGGALKPQLKEPVHHGLSGLLKEVRQVSGGDADLTRDGVSLH